MNASSNNECWSSTITKTRRLRRPCSSRTWVEARVAYDGESALAMLHEYEPEVVLLDIGMPGLDGYETCQRIRHVLGSRVLLVALTGFGQEQDKEKATRAGFDVHLTKPAAEAALAEIFAYPASSGT